MLEGVLQVDSGASQLQIDKTVPDLLCLVEGEDALAFSSVFVTGCILENVVVPED